MIIEAFKNRTGWKDSPLQTAVMRTPSPSGEQNCHARSKTVCLFVFEMAQICKWAFLELLCSRSSGVSYQENLHWEKYQRLGSIEGKFNIQTKAVLPSLSILCPEEKQLMICICSWHKLKTKDPSRAVVTTQISAWCKVSALLCSCSKWIALSSITKNRGCGPSGLFPL